LLQLFIFVIHRAQASNATEDVGDI